MSFSTRPGRHFGVVVELHRERAAAARAGAQEVDVAEHLRQRHEALTTVACVALLALVRDLTAAAVDVADDRAEIVASLTTSIFMIGSSSFGLLALCASRKHARPAISNASAERVDVVVLAVDAGARGSRRPRSRRPGRACARSSIAFSTAGMNSRGMRPPTTSSENSTPRARRRAARRSSSLRRTGPSRRTASCACRRARPCWPNASRKLTRGPAHVGLDAELGAHAVDRDLEVQLAHAAQHGLARFLVDLETQRRIGLDHLVERRRHLVDVGARLRLDRRR